MSENKRNVDRDVELAKPSQGNAHPTGTSTLEANRQQYAEPRTRLPLTAGAASAV